MPRNIHIKILSLTISFPCENTLIEQSNWLIRDKVIDIFFCEKKIQLTIEMIEQEYSSNILQNYWTMTMDNSYLNMMLRVVS